MKKRTFVKVLSGAAASASLSDRLSAWPAAQRLSNWAGNLEYSTSVVLEPRSLDELRTLVKAQRNLRALGTRHCFNKIADSRAALLTLKSMPEEVSINAAAKTVTVNAGITYGRLAQVLDAKGFALHNLASLPHISVVGSCSTGTHGSGEGNRNLSGAVAGLEMVSANGEIVRLSRQQDGTTFRGAVVGLGALGVITRVTLDIQPTFAMRQYVYENMPMRMVKDNFDAIQAAGYSVSLFTDWQKGRVNEVWVKCREDANPKFAAAPAWLGARRAAKNLHPIAELGAENCTEQMGVAGPWYERLPHFRMGFTPSAGKELQSEYFVPRKNGVEAMLAVERLRDQIGPHLMISEIRTIAADDLWLSPAYGRPSVALHFTWKQDLAEVSKLLPVIERELGPFKPRPHWGKLFTMGAAQLRAAYERMPEFVELAEKMDPGKKFRNEFLNGNVF